MFDQLHVVTGQSCRLLVYFKVDFRKLRRGKSKCFSKLKNLNLTGVMCWNIVLCPFLLTLIAGLCYFQRNLYIVISRKVFLLHRLASCCIWREGRVQEGPHTGGHMAWCNQWLLSFHWGPGQKGHWEAHSWNICQVWSLTQLYIVSFLLFKDHFKRFFFQNLKSWCSYWLPYVVQAPPHLTQRSTPGSVFVSY